MLERSPSSIPGSALPSAHREEARSAADASLPSPGPVGRVSPSLPDFSDLPTANPRLSRANRGYMYCGRGPSRFLPGGPRPSGRELERGAPRSGDGRLWRFSPRTSSTLWPRSLDLASRRGHAAREPVKAGGVRVRSPR